MLMEGLVGESKVYVNLCSVSRAISGDARINVVTGPYIAVVVFSKYYV
jgi:hypothetical protein